jgi:hypothetical protein
VFANPAERAPTGSQPWPESEKEMVRSNVNSSGVCSIG